MALARSETQTDSSRIWTHDADSISICEYSLRFPRDINSILEIFGRTIILKLVNR